MKHGKKTIMVRTFKKEVKEATRKLYVSKDLCEKCGIEYFNKSTNNGNFKREGNIFYYRNHKKDNWKWFFQIVALSDSNSMRSADDVDVDTIIYDEFLMTPDKEKRYHGNRVEDFIDIFISSKREHIVRCFFLGNKECVLNPFFSYFGINALPIHFNGYKVYRNGSICVYQKDVKRMATNNYEKRVDDLLKATSYGNYLNEGNMKNQYSLKQRKIPNGAVEYVQLNFNGNEIKVYSYETNFYVNSTIDKNRIVYTDRVLNKYKNEKLLIKAYKRYFIALINALSDNRVYYVDYASYEAIQSFYSWLSF